MRFTELALPGVYQIDLEPHYDERGFFARTWCRDEFARRGLQGDFVQCSLSFNREAGTLRGMHFQAEPYQEVKLVRCTKGAIFDVLVDLRQASPTYKHWIGVELTAESHRTLYVPQGVAHGFQTLRPESEVYYQISTEYVREASRGLRWDDPAIGIVWPPCDQRVISERDRQFADYLG